LTGEEQIQKCMKCGRVTSVVYHGKPVTTCPNCGSSEFGKPIELSKTKIA
jgi:DNA-directed RNA polymerase subunit RPC12/RpoP